MFSPSIDLHCHTTLSDGNLTPQDLTDRAREAGIHILSITDHNHTEDLSLLRAANPDMLFIQGAEFSGIYRDADDNEHEIHIVGLGFDREHPAIRTVLHKNNPDRRARIEAFLARLQQCGVELGTYETLRARFPDTVHLGRMQLAELMKEKGYVTSVDEAFDRYIGSFGLRLAYVENTLRYASMEEVVRAILDAGGVPILCHLYYYRMSPVASEQLVQKFAQLTEGKGGMEVYYAKYDVMQRLELLRLCNLYGLMPSAASDYHGQSESDSLWNQFSYCSCSEILNCLGISVPNATPTAPILVISGPSGSGKGTITETILRERRSVNGQQVSMVVSATTRTPRGPGDHYIFITNEEFGQMVAENQFLEHNDAYCEHRYGTPVDSVRKVMESGALPCLEIDRVGLSRLLTEGKVNPKLIRSVFVVAPAEEIARRLIDRGTESRDVILARLRTAVLEAACSYLYNAVVVNETVDTAVAEVLQVFSGRSVLTPFDPEQFRREMESVVDSLCQNMMDLDVPSD